MSVRELPGYRILCELPSGFGRTFQAEQRSTGRSVLLRSFGAPGLNIEQRELLNEELQQSCLQAASVTTSRVVQVHELVRAPAGRWVLVTDFINAPSLAEMPGLIEDPQCDENMVLLIVKGLAEALRDMHRAGVAHGCVMPGWVLVGEHGGIHLDGLGLAPVLARTARKSRMKRSRGKRAQRSSGIDWYRLQPHEEEGLSAQERDLFQVAVVATYLMTGKLPLGGDGTRPALADEFDRWMHRLSLH